MTREGLLVRGFAVLLVLVIMLCAVSAAQGRPSPPPLLYASCRFLIPPDGHPKVPSACVYVAIRSNHYA